MAAEGFDYVVLGGGSAGCVVASRLSEDPAVSVALIEAGPPDHDEVFRVPGRFSELQKSSFDWDLATEAESALGGRRAYLPRGRVLGGTSSINTMLYVRGSSADYDEWAAHGCDGWSYEEVLPLFRRSEDNQTRGESLPRCRRPTRGQRPRFGSLAARVLGGRRHRSRPSPQRGLQRPRSGSGSGSTRRPSATAPGPALRRRSSSRPGGGQTSSILTSTQAHRILWSGTRAVGVEVEYLGDDQANRGRARSDRLGRCLHVTPAALALGDRVGR